MTNELFAYLLLVILGLFLYSFKRSLKIDFVLFFLLSMYFLLIRSSGFDMDMAVYAETMASDSISIYYLKEPIYWFGTRLVYTLTGSELLTFWFFDLIAISLVFYFSQLVGIKYFYIFIISFLIFFPSLMGYQNIYRQFFSTCLLLSSFYSITSRNIFLASIFFALSVLTHNVAALFLPVFFLIKKRPNYTIFLIGAVSVIALIPFAVSTKSHSDTGDTSVLIYISVLFLVLCFSVFTMFNSMKGKTIVIMVCYFISLSFVAGLVTGTAQSKRVGLMSLLLLLPWLFNMVIVNYKQRDIILILIYLFLIIPTLMSSSSNQFLL
ncbi:EpsG family protein [Vibrio splendidus]|uniref:EpsG family protein n=1 Tax=Vibrio splendidus TaxID=29497 RepID=UPI000D37ADD9|nr:EpsG family protein [Vibrio splendidus]PTP57011.1 hypothetical protein CWN83_05660 [Vibrio splendidus]